MHVALQVRRGLTLAEIVMAIGFIAIFTTGLMLFATKGLQLSSRQIDHAGAYQICEALMEEYHQKSLTKNSFDAIQSVASYTYPTTKKQDGTVETNREFVYTVAVDKLSDEMKKIQVKVFVASHKGSTPTPHPDLPRGGEVVRMTNFYNAP